MRRRTDRDAAGPPGLSGAAGRPGIVPERHPLDAHDPRAGSRSAEPLGAARPGESPPGARRSTPTRSTSGRSRSRARRDRRTASPRRMRRAGRSSTRSSSTLPTAPGSRSASASPSTRSSSKTARSSVSAATARTAETVVETGSRRDRGGWAQLPRGQGRGARAVQRQAEAAVELLHLLARPAGRRFRDLHPSRPGLGRGVDE